MTVELAVALPALIIVAVIAVNALLFMSECAAFDRVAHDAVRTYAASPAYGQGPDQVTALVKTRIESTIEGRDYVKVSVSREHAGFDLERYKMTLEFTPTLFGKGMRSNVFGVSIPPLKHTTEFVIDSYKPGVVV